MICPEAKEKLQARADGELRAEDRAALEEHLLGCRACSTEAERIERFLGFLSDRLGRLRSPAPPDLTWLSEQEPAEAPGPAEATAAAKPGSFRIPVFVPVVGIVLVLGVAGWLAFREGEPASSPGDVADIAGGPDRPVRTTPRDPEPEPARPAPAEPASAGSEPDPVRPTGPRPVPVKPGATQLLARFLRSPTDAVLAQVWEALAEKPAESRTLLATWGRTAPEETRERILLLLALAGASEEPAVRTALLGALEGEGEPGLRAAAAAALARSQDGGGRVAAYGNLSVPVGPIRDPDLRSALVAAAESERDPTTLGVMIRVLGPSQSVDPTITDRLLELARGDVPEIRRAAIEAIRLGRPREPRLLLDLVQDRRLPASLRADLVEPAALAEPDRALEHLKGIYRRAEEDEVKAAVAGALSRIPGDETRAFASEILFGRDSAAVRSRTLGLFAGDRSAESLQILRRVAESDEDPGLRQMAEDARRRIEEELEREEEGR